jgi:hypothetical protein
MVGSSRAGDAGAEGARVRAVTAAIARVVAAAEIRKVFLMVLSSIGVHTMRRVVRHPSTWQSLSTGRY